MFWTYRGFEIELQAEFYVVSNQDQCFDMAGSLSEAKEVINNLLGEEYVPEGLYKLEERRPN